MKTEITYPFRQTSRVEGIRLCKSKHGLFGAPSVKIVSICDTSNASNDITLLTSGVWAEESESEFFFHISHLPRLESCRVTVEIDWPQAELAAVLCAGASLPFVSDGRVHRFSVELCGLRGRSKTLDVHTHITEPGLLLRVEQNAEHRRAGCFRSAPWPEVEINAALHYMLAARQVLRAMGLPAKLYSGRLGRVALMGFETNNPPHVDYPPHWHLICEWPHWYGSSAPHLYLDRDGRNVRNVVTVNGARASVEYKPGEWCILTGHTGEALLALQLCVDGALAVTAPDYPVFVLFYDKAEQACVVRDTSKRELARVQACNLPDKGLLTSSWIVSASDVSNASLPRSMEETVTYDPLSGQLLGAECREIPV